MKNYLLFALLFFAQSILAQNWMPFRVGETYNYIDLNNQSVVAGVYRPGISCAGAFQPPVYYNGISTNAGVSWGNTRQIWIDSIVLNNNLDSVFYFNTQVIVCDTCPTAAIVVHQPMNLGIIQDTFVKNSLGQYIFHHNGDSLLFDPNWVLNDSILSDYSSMLFVKVVYEDTDLICNSIVDSAKVVYYCDTNNVVLYKAFFTKNNGISYFEDSNNNLALVLVGLESKKIGDTQATIDNIFDYDIGDQFFYQEKKLYNMEEDNLIYGLKILNKQVVALDTVVYTIEKKGWYFYFCCFGVSGNYNGTFTFTVTPNSISNNLYSFYSYAEIERLNLRDNEPNTTHWVFSSAFTKVYYAKNFLFGNFTNEYKYLSYSFGINSSFYPQGVSFFVNSTSNVYLSNQYFQPMSDGDSFSELYGKGLGLIQRYETSFETTHCITLLGYIKGTDTVGTVIPDNILLGTQNPLEQLSNNKSIQLYPNPANQNLTIELSQTPQNKQIQLEVLDLQGRVLLSQQKTSQNSYNISLEGIPNGLYLLQLKDEAGGLLAAEKFVVKKG